MSNGRCSVGQQWNGTSCEGKIIRLNHDDVAKAIVIANEQLGGTANPKRAGRLGCAGREPIKIDSGSFLQTVRTLLDRRGKRFCRAAFIGEFMTDIPMAGFPQQELAVRFVRDRWSVFVPVWLSFNGQACR